MSTVPVRAEGGFWRRPFVQDVLPLVSSLMVHVGIVVLGIVTYQTIRIMNEPVSVPPPVLADSFIQDDTALTALKGLPTGDDVFNRQDRFPNVPPDAEGLSATPSKITAALAGGSAAESADDAVALGLKRSFGPARGNGIGLTAGDGMGTGDGDGVGLAPWGRNANVRAVTFVNQREGASKVVFLCDSSGSMMNKFDALRQELRRSVDRLRPGHQFDIIFFAADRHVALDPQLLYALPENKRRAHEFLDRVAPHDSSDPISGLRAAFATGPELIFMLTDGDFPNNEAVLEEIGRLNVGRRVKINTIAFIDPGEEYEKLLGRIARENGGTFKFVAEKDLER